MKKETETKILEKNGHIGNATWKYNYMYKSVAGYFVH